MIYTKYQHFIKNTRWPNTFEQGHSRDSFDSIISMFKSNKPVRDQPIDSARELYELEQTGCFYLLVGLCYRFAQTGYFHYMSIYAI